MEKSKKGIIETLFFLLYMILPSYFAFEFSSSLPLLTGSRIILILFILNYLLKNKRKINLKVFFYNRDGIGFEVYIILLLFVNFFNISITTESIKQIFLIILEELFVVWIIVKNLTTKEKVINCLKLIAFSSACVAIVSIIGSITGNNIFYYLNTVNREMLMSNYSRLSFVRASAGFGHAVYYGAYNVIMIPIIIFLIENDKKNNMKYTIFLILDILALMFANSRGSLLVCVIMLIYMFVWKKRKINNYINFILISLFGLIIILIIKPEIINFFGNIFTSVKNIFVVNKVDIDNYGNNVDGLKSRTKQFSEILWTLKNNPILGFGASSQNRGVVKFLDDYGRWHDTYTFDIGYVAIFCNYGIIGSIGYLFLYISIFLVIFSKKNNKDNPLLQMFKFVFISYFLCLFSIAELNNTFWVLYGAFVSYINIMRKTEIDNKVK